MSSRSDADFREQLAQWHAAMDRLEELTAGLKSLREDLDTYERTFGPIAPRSPSPEVADGCEEPSSRYP